MKILVALAGVGLLVVAVVVAVVLFIPLDPQVTDHRAGAPALDDDDPQAGDKLIVGPKNGKPVPAAKVIDGPFEPNDYALAFDHDGMVTIPAFPSLERATLPSKPG